MFASGRPRTILGANRSNRSYKKYLCGLLSLLTHNPQSPRYVGKIRSNIIKTMAEETTKRLSDLSAKADEVTDRAEAALQAADTSSQNTKSILRLVKDNQKLMMSVTSKNGVLVDEKHTIVCGLFMKVSCVLPTNLPPQLTLCSQLSHRFLGL